MDDWRTYEYVSQNIGHRISNIRRKLKFTQQEVAERAGILRTSLVNYESGRGGITVKSLYRVADALGVEAAELMPRNEDVHFGTEANAQEELIKLAACIVANSPAAMAEAELRARRIMGCAQEPTEADQ